METITFFILNLFYRGNGPSVQICIIIIIELYKTIITKTGTRTEGQIIIFTMIADVKSYFLKSQFYFMMVCFQVSKFVLVLLYIIYKTIITFMDTRRGDK